MLFELVKLCARRLGWCGKKRESTPTELCLSSSRLNPKRTAEQQKRGECGRMFARSCWFPAIVRTFSITHIWQSWQCHTFTPFIRALKNSHCNSCMSMHRRLSLSVLRLLAANSSNLHRRYILSAFLSILRGSTATTSHFVVNEHKYVSVCVYLGDCVCVCVCAVEVEYRSPCNTI